MRLRYIKTGWAMTIRELLRSRIVIILIFLIPTLFYALIALTTPRRIIPFKLASVSGEPVVEVSMRDESLVFIGLAAVGFIVSFLAMSLIQKQTEAHRRLILCGYRPMELVVSKLAVLLCVIVLISLFVAAMLPLFFRPDRFALVFLGFALGGFVYGCYGLLVGALCKRELEGILFIVLLSNIDVGWLQNPTFYADAQNTAIIRYLPAYFPSQMSMVAAFTKHSITNSLIGSLLYGSAFLIVSVLIFWWKMRIGKQRG
ncbi:MAG: ABC transporter permease [Acidobacteria bacterium]|nr:ABC transporter permease [Acidobacteriota bacterium]